MPGGGRDIDLGAVALRIQQRRIDGPLNSIQVEPLVMRLLVALASRAGRMVNRDTLFERCWPGVAVGDDSLNRLVAVARRSLSAVGGDRVEIVTIPAAGYMLRLRAAATDQRIFAEECDAIMRAAFASWRGAYPVPDYPVIERIKAIAHLGADRADCWGMLALMYRHAAEYGPLDERAEMVRSCEDAGAQALAIDPSQAEARIALASIVPIYGNWRDAHAVLSEVLQAHPDNVIAAHDLSIVEMATGRAREAKRLVDPLVAADPLAPCFGYKSTYQHWSLGDLETMDHRADRAIQLWPDHPAVWTSRFWTLAHTGRPTAALAMIEPGVHRPVMSDPIAEFARRLLGWVEDRSGDRSPLVKQAVDAVASGPAQAINSLMALGLLGDVDAGFEVAEAYYLQAGRLAVPSHGDRELPINEMRRRLTQQLFTPACAAMRADARIESLFDRIGLLRYWDQTGRWPEVEADGLTARRGH